ncbi:MAG: Rrf2 family transcriptional regulator [Gammaproteobacteria bacterium]|nr:Rrf2 family transcriptional regulator [Gammaproteobacteria bacterium]MDH5730360.1 Rrf2 family transcriptional regulator [Gammaproteobacteria bacterium]
MKISSKARYAVTAMIDLAIHSGVGPLTIAGISQKQNISLSYLEQIFTELRHAGLVKGTRGPGGGYRLARPAADVTIAQVIDALGDSHPQLGRGADGYEPNVKWAGLSRHLYSFLDGITLSQCVEDEAGREFFTASDNEDSDSTNTNNQVAAA